MGIATAARDAEAPFHPAAHKADVVLESQDDVRFYVVKSILAYASPFFENLFSDAMPHESAEGKPLVRLHDDSDLLRKTLQLFYPCNVMPDFTTAEEVTEVHAIAKKYCMVDFILPALERAVRHSTVFHCHPVLLYCVAVRLRLPNLTHCAAKKCLSINYASLFTDDGFDEHFEYLTGRDVTRLSNYHQRCGEAALKLAKSNGPLWIRLNKLPCPWAFKPDEWKFFHTGDSTILSRAPVLYGHSWLSAYVNAIVGLLQSQPCLESVDKLDVFTAVTDAMHREVKGCSTCQKDVLTRFDDLKKAIAEELERAIMAVRSPHHATYDRLLTVFYLQVEFEVGFSFES